ncbi:heme oxygenase (biliverdin-producing) [Dactylosporangium sucinum]|uniref:Biliverdin-producing heme oxygenase n=1 Tax=Dactylosporangium sucinum TaxID=1424081 RepID=A0A917TZA3_9ACTN|nr:biliverdin-producing heme oxygenase [Dactylosporangium sucinum]GGM46847.1 biliverdin-producing heme oxygenase [Dactylosporangium sucinum]
MVEELFSAAVRRSTEGRHRDAEQAAFLGRLVTGALPLAGYAAMVAQHHHIYSVLEEAAAVMRHDPVARPFVHDGLTRLPALESDLRTLLGDDWQRRIEPSPATTRYAERLREVCFAWPGGFVAHHYTRYLGDLSGGQYIAAAVRRHYGTTATGFYVFDGIGSPAAFKTGYREALDTAPWDPDERRRILDEVLVAYQLNIDVLTDLGRDHAAGQAA